MNGKRPDEQVDLAYSQNGRIVEPVFPLLIGIFSMTIVGLALNRGPLEFLWTPPGGAVFVGMTLISAVILSWIDQSTGERYRWELWSSSDSQQRSGGTESSSSSEKEE